MLSGIWRRATLEEKSSSPYDPPAPPVIAVRVTEPEAHPRRAGIDGPDRSSRGNLLRRDGRACPVRP
jgi:hypothetical protein